MDELDNVTDGIHTDDTETTPKNDATITTQEIVYQPVDNDFGLAPSYFKSDNPTKANIAEPSKHNTNTSKDFDKNPNIEPRAFAEVIDLMKNNPEESISKETQETREQMSFEKQIETYINYGDEYVEHKMLIEELNKLKNLSLPKFENKKTFLLEKYPKFKKDIETITHENNNQYIGELVKKYTDDSTDEWHKLETLNKSVSDLNRSIDTQTNAINKSDELLFITALESLKQNHNLIYKLLFNENGKLKKDTIHNIMLLYTKVKAEDKKAKNQIEYEENKNIIELLKKFSNSSTDSNIRQKLVELGHTDIRILVNNINEKKSHEYIKENISKEINKYKKTMESYKTNYYNDKPKTVIVKAADKKNEVTKEYKIATTDNDLLINNQELINNPNTARDDSIPVRRTEPKKKKKNKKNKQKNEENIEEPPKSTNSSNKPPRMSLLPDIKKDIEANRSSNAFLQKNVTIGTAVKEAATTNEEADNGPDYDFEEDHESEVIEEYKYNGGNRKKNSSQNNRGGKKRKSNKTVKKTIKRYTSFRRFTKRNNKRCKKYTYKNQ